MLVFLQLLLGLVLLTVAIFYNILRALAVPFGGF